MRLRDVILRDTRANQPAAADVDVGTLYGVTDEGDILERSSGSAWEAFSPTGSGSGTVTNTGTLTDHALVVGNAGVDVTVVASLGTSTTLLHGAAAGDPTWGAVVEADITLANNTTNDVSIAAHGFAPIAPNDATKYLDGTGAYSVPVGAGGGLVLLEQHSASASASLDFTTFISSTYDTYLCVGSQLVLATSAANLLLEMGTGGGPTYDTGSNYEWSANGLSTDGGAYNDSGSSGVAKIMASMGNTAGWAGTFSLTISALQSTALRKTALGDTYFITSTPKAVKVSYGMQWTTAGTAVTALRFIASSGNITSGTIRIYGIAK